MKNPAYLQWLGVHPTVGCTNTYSCCVSCRACGTRASRGQGPGCKSYHDRLSACTRRKHLSLVRVRVHPVPSIPIQIPQFCYHEIHARQHPIPSASMSTIQLHPCLTASCSRNVHAHVLITSMIDCIPFLQDRCTHPVYVHARLQPVPTPSIPAS